MATQPRSSFESTGSSPPQTSITSKDLPYRSLVIADPVAARFLEDEPSTNVLAHRETLPGFETYLVEQWACNRARPTYVISTYTGDLSHTTTVAVLSAPLDQNDWSPKVRAYFDALQQHYARPRETALGMLMATNLSSFPSSLTLIKVPEGNVRKHWEDFVVNEDLKRLGCAGRAGLTLTQPTSATVAKFHQLYRTSEKVPLYQSVMDLVKLCQLALVLFGKLPLDYGDGLLCDVTEAAIKDWWVEFGAEFFSIEPNDGILGPTTVAALVGLVMGARNRLHAYGAPVSKDVFEVEATKRAIAYFQKASRLPKTRRLDRRTLQRLHSATAKAAEQKSGEGWTVPRAVKSTVAELSGKGGEMVMEMVGRGGGEKAGIAAVETVDFETFIDLLGGGSAKWLWHGKGKKFQSSDVSGKYASGTTGEKDHPLSRKISEAGKTEPPTLRKQNTVEDGASVTSDIVRQSSIREPESAMDGDRDRKSRRHALQRAGIKVKDTVSGKRHQPKGSKDAKDGTLYPEEADDSKQILTSIPPSPTAVSVDQVAKDHTNSPSESQSVLSKIPTFASAMTETPSVASRNLFSSPTLQLSAPNIGTKTEPVAPTNATQPELGASNATKPELGAPIHLEPEPKSRSPIKPLLTGPTYHGVDLNDLFGIDTNQEISPLLRTTYSTSNLPTLRALRALPPNPSNLPDPTPPPPHDVKWPRHLSFSVAESSILTWSKLDTGSSSPHPGLHAEYHALLYDGGTLRRLRERLRELSCLHEGSVAPQLQRLVTVLDTAAADQGTVEGLYEPSLETYGQARDAMHDTLESERGKLMDAVREVEVLASRLEYEMAALRNKVEGVEEAVGEFGGAVRELEERIGGIEGEDRSQGGWGSWVMGVLFGVAGAARVEGQGREEGG
ncbi:hypothetical protein P152DRAFT_487875 [Eremomyces bilateralis CBS 781.70]|uniref:STB6-like N-terminal domain-containing protein n=1 Tax=Eremomyces bilateralis CBS 781.70 TaxID=1392243 RepID=A0A6G1G2G7_9PEZI|nr:uncharacterized protein P152DRAFT_487875 [Eremomyces bilateralis CBS 781.70]KAF1812307.1 hypothetical protein P152DRAFT_487875 [Eremomyces bilateralis CBS 781.70]